MKPQHVLATAVLLTAFASSQAPTVAQAQVSLAPFPAASRYPINIEVVDQRPRKETVPEVGYKAGYAYTAWGPENQGRNFAQEIGERVKRFGGAPSYLNLNTGAVRDPAGLTFRFVITHWYARWPIRFDKDPVLVEGAFDTVLRVTLGDNTIYEKSYSTKGIPQFATTYGVNTRDTKEYFRFMERVIGVKGNQVLRTIADEISNDLSATWTTILRAERN